MGWSTREAGKTSLQGTTTATSTGPDIRRTPTTVPCMKEGVGSGRAPVWRRRLLVQQLLHDVRQCTGCIERWQRRFPVHKYLRHVHRSKTQSHVAYVQAINTIHSQTFSSHKYHSRNRCRMDRNSWYFEGLQIHYSDTSCTDYTYWPPQTNK